MDGACGGVIGARGAIDGDACKVYAGQDIDVIGGDEQGNLYVGSEGMVVTIGGVSGAHNITGNIGDINVSGGADAMFNECYVENRGEKEKSANYGGGGGANSMDGLGGDGDSPNNIVICDGEDEVFTGGVKSEEDIIGGDVTGPDVSGVDSADVSTREGPDVDSVGGAGVSAREGLNVSPIPLIPRRRLREILEHAQGECIISSVFIVCI